jgi:hypothetical protein
MSFPCFDDVELRNEGVVNDRFRSLDGIEGELREVVGVGGVQVGFSVSFVLLGREAEVHGN